MKYININIKFLYRNIALIVSAISLPVLMYIFQNKITNNHRIYDAYSIINLIDKNRTPKELIRILHTADKLKRQGEYEKALKLYTEALAMLSRTEDARLMGYTLIGLGDVTRSLRPQSIQNTKSIYTDAISIFQTIKDKVGEGLALRGIAKLEYQQGNYNLSEQLNKQAIKYFSQENYAIGEGKTLYIWAFQQPSSLMMS